MTSPGEFRRSATTRQGIVGSAGKSSRSGAGISGSGASANAFALYLAGRAFGARVVQFHSRQLLANVLSESLGTHEMPCQ